MESASDHRVNPRRNFRVGRRPPQQQRGPALAGPRLEHQGLLPRFLQTQKASDLLRPMQTQQELTSVPSQLVLQQSWAASQTPIVFNSDHSAVKSTSTRPRRRKNRTRGTKRRQSRTADRRLPYTHGKFLRIPDHHLSWLVSVGGVVNKRSLCRGVPLPMLCTGLTGEYRYMCWCYK